MSKVEAVARAIRKAIMDQQPDHPWPPLTDPVDPDEMDIARAAIAAGKTGVLRERRQTSRPTTTADGLGDVVHNQTLHHLPIITAGLLPQHSHMSEVYSINTADTRLTDEILQFVKTGK